jgi:probable O-glycosylation ligase (exosortase A-associated)
MWQIINKIFLMTLVTMLLITTRQKLVYFLLALVGFVGFVGVKGAVFGILTGGEHKIWGPPDSFLADNNALGLAMLMLVPFCFQLRGLMEKRWQSRVLLGVGVALIISTVLTYSRGALVGLVVVGLFYLLASRHRVRLALAGAVVLVIAFNLLPSAWFDRMSTIRTYEEDGSANMRLNSWAMSWNLAKDNPFGGGFDCFTMDEYYKYAPDPELGRLGKNVGSTAHSLYFEVLATQGFGGFAIYMLGLGSLMASLIRIQRSARDLPDGESLRAISGSLLASILGFMSCGAFQSKAFFDMFWAIFAVGVCLKYMVDNGRWAEATAPAPAEPLEHAPAIGRVRSPQP